MKELSIYDVGNLSRSQWLFEGFSAAKPYDS